MNGFSSPLLSVLSLIAAVVLLSSSVHGQASHPVEEAAALAQEKGVKHALKLLETRAAEGAKHGAADRFEKWLVRLTSRLYELDEHELGEECFVYGEALLEGDGVRKARGPSRALLRGQLYESRGDIEDAALAYLEAATADPDDEQAAKALRKIERRLAKGRVEHPADSEGL